MSDPTPGTDGGPRLTFSLLTWPFLAPDRRLRVLWRVTLLLAGTVLAYVAASGIVVAVTAVGLGYEPGGPANLADSLFHRLPYWPLLVNVVALPPLILLVWCFRRYLDRRSWRSLGFEAGPPALREAGVGLVLGSAAIFLSIAPLALSGAVENAALGGSGVPRTSGPTDLLIVLGCLVGAAFGEELVARAYILSNVRESLGSGAGVLISAAIFAGLHMENPHVSALPTINILLAGLLLGTVFVLTGRLWMAWTLHFSWNACQGMLLGLPVSGLTVPSLFRLRLVGSDLVTGGAFGLEGSLWNTVAASVILSVVVSIGVRRRRTVAGPGPSESSACSRETV